MITTPMGARFVDAEELERLTGDQVRSAYRMPDEPRGLPAADAVVVAPATFTSWINQVERWFGYLTEQKSRRGAHKSVRALEKDIRAWITDWNTNPKPFVWKKTADEILDSLARYLQRISGGHTRVR